MLPWAEIICCGLILAALLLAGVVTSRPDRN